MIRPNNPQIDVTALDARVASEAGRLRSASSEPSHETPLPIDEVAARLALIADALEAALESVRNARERNVARARIPSSVAKLGPVAGAALRAYNIVFAPQRELDAQQNDALVAVVHAVRELALTQRALIAELEALRASIK